MPYRDERTVEETVICRGWTYDDNSDSDVKILCEFEETVEIDLYNGVGEWQCPLCGSNYTVDTGVSDYE